MKEMMNLFKKSLTVLVIALIINTNAFSLNINKVIVTQNKSISLSEGETFDVKISIFIYNSDIKSYELTSASIKIWGDKPYSLTDSLFAYVNTITVKTGSSKYKLEINKPGFETYKEEFSSTNFKTFYTKPLIVILNKKSSKIKNDKKTGKEIGKDSITTEPNNALRKLDKNLLAWYPFSGNANDSSGNNYHGEDYGEPGYIAGINSEARYFSNNQNSEAIVTDFTIIPNVIDNDEFTINFWAKLDYSETHQSIIYLSEGEDWTRANFFLSLSSDMKLAAIINSLDLRTIDYSHNMLLSKQFSNGYKNSKSLELNKFYNITCVLKNSVFIIYVDGKVYAKYNNIYKTIGKPDAMILIGACPKPGTLYYPYTGQIDELRFYIKALNESEIQLLQKNQK
jgi:hypothetical protein